MNRNFRKSISTLLYWGLYSHQNKRLEGSGAKYLYVYCSRGRDIVSTFNYVFEYQPIASEILTQPSRYKRAESNLLADEKGPQDRGQVAAFVKHLYLLHLLYNTMLLLVSILCLKYIKFFCTFIVFVISSLIHKKWIKFSL